MILYIQNIFRLIFLYIKPLHSHMQLISNKFDFVYMSWVNILHYKTETEFKKKIFTKLLLYLTDRTNRNLNFKNQHHVHLTETSEICYIFSLMFTLSTNTFFFLSFWELNEVQSPCAIGLNKRSHFVETCVY